jgi:hypothetical protein
MLASGPDMSAALVFSLLVLALCVILPMAFFIHAFVQFHRERLWPGLACILLSVMFLIPLWGFRTDAYRVFILFGVVSVIAAPIWFFLVYRK